MTHPTAATRRVLFAAALSVTALLTPIACSADGPGRSPMAPGSPTAPGSATDSTGRAAEQPAGAPPALTDDQARAALLTEADLGEPWQWTRGFATWRDGLLKATTENRDCQRLLDALYTEELFGAPTGAGASIGLDDAYSGAQLHHRVATHRAADVDRTLAWMRSLPQRCGTFKAAAARGGTQGGRVTEVPLPSVGDARQALRITLAGETQDGKASLLTVDVAAVLVGGDAISLTHGGLGEVRTEVTRTAVELGVQRLTEVRQLGRAVV